MRISDVVLKKTIPGHNCQSGYKRSSQTCNNRLAFTFQVSILARGLAILWGFHLSVLCIQCPQGGNMDGWKIVFMALSPQLRNISTFQPPKRASGRFTHVHGRPCRIPIIPQIVYRNVYMTSPICTRGGSYSMKQCSAMTWRCN